MSIKTENIKNKLHSFIEEGKLIYTTHIYDNLYLSGTEYEEWLTSTSNYLRKEFGDKDVVKRYSEISINANGNFASEAEKLLGILNSLFNNIDIYIDDNWEDEKMNNNSKVFIVHGHDDMLLTQIDLLLTQLKLKPIVLKNEPNGGLNSIFDKLIQNADVGYAIVLFTPDDVGSKKGEECNLKTRARQNVVLELGYFAGKLGRDKVCFLNKGVEDLPSDISGITYTDGFDWKYKIVDELKMAGYTVSKDDVK